MLKNKYTRVLNSPEKYFKQKQLNIQHLPIQYSHINHSTEEKNIKQT